jgi:short-subunit dehydrogenase
VDKIAERAIAEFGTFDTWVNNAAVSIFGKLDETHLDEKRRLFDVNFWGVVHGCRTAVPQLRKTGGAIINIGSVLSDRAVPIQGIYSASKHAVKAYTDALRMELEAEKAPISVTLVKPGAIDTPYTENAAVKMEHAPTHTPPVYAPEVVAKAILECAAHPQRDVYVGGSAKLISMLESFMPRLTDLFMERTMMESGQSSAKLDETRPMDQGALYRPSGREGKVRGNYPGHVAKSSAYTSASLHPGAVAMIATGLGVVAAAGIGLWQSRRAAGAQPLTTKISPEEQLVH